MPASNSKEAGVRKEKVMAEEAKSIDPVTPDVTPMQHTGSSTYEAFDFGVTREDFLAFEDVRRSGVVNMWSSEVERLAGINKKIHLAITPSLLANT